ncbi:hypothetical protein HDU81_008046 [Chytriomyces hyalinus]|nr:hypothetical protein HDU81_008046 [Chytriomyces hyalinus]
MGGKEDDQNTFYGATTDKGRRETQQDEQLIVENLFEGHPRASLFAVFDGHGTDGAKVSAFVKKTFPRILRESKAQLTGSSKEAATALKSAFATVNELIKENQAIDAYMSGTTATLLIFFEEDRRVLVANLGDSRIIMGRLEGDETVPVQITTDHTCANAEEMDRVVKSGGRIDQMLTDEGGDGPLRIYKGTLPYPGKKQQIRLVVTRSLGDTCAERLGVLCEPEVIDRELSKNDRFFVLASDGLWDGLDLDQVVHVVQKYDSPVKASEVLNRKALKSLDAKCIDDNVTNIVVHTA